MFTFSKAEPYDNVDYRQMGLYLRNGNRLAKPPNCSPSIYALMNECWQFENKDRPDFETLLSRLTQLQPHEL